jgi:hypothetical protein
LEPGSGHSPSAFLNVSLGNAITACQLPEIPGPKSGIRPSRYAPMGGRSSIPKGAEAASNGNKPKVNTPRNNPPCKHIFVEYLAGMKKVNRSGREISYTLKPIRTRFG